jgi:cyclopropane-fatty-acyl-phospholipid synthase
MLHVPPADIVHTLRVSAANLAEATRDLPALARAAFGYAVRITRGSLTVIAPDGRRYLFEGSEKGPAATIHVHDWGMLKRLISGGDIGFAEGYLRGEWETPDLTAFLYLFCVNQEAVATLFGGRPIHRLWQVFQHWMNRNTRSQAKKNITAHYDLGNQFYAAWLDPTMTYSSALFESEGQDITEAQIAKYRALCEDIGLAPGQHVLEIGCGWGGFAEVAARDYGAKVTGLTISREQHDFAVERMAKAGLSDRVTIKLQDYRDERGTYDRVASIEMIEAVGEEYWPVYFRQVSERLKPGGRAGIQAITIQERFFPQYRREIDFIRRYIFPGGMLAPAQIWKNMGEKVGLSFSGEREFGQDYARTLDVWRQRFRAAWPDLTPLGFDERFRRLWEYYLAYCEAGFKSRNIDVRQMVFEKVR